MTALQAWDVRPRVRPTDISSERRAATRLPIEVDVDVEGAAHRFRSTSIDLSTGGMFVMTHCDIPVGTHVMLAFTLPGDVALEVIGVVQWRRERHDASGTSPGLGVAFFCLDPEVKNVLDAFCEVREPLYSPSAESGAFLAARPDD